MVVRSAVILRWEAVAASIKLLTRPDDQWPRRRAVQGVFVDAEVILG